MSIIVKTDFRGRVAMYGKCLVFGNMKLFAEKIQLILDSVFLRENNRYSFSWSLLDSFVYKKQTAC